MVFRLPTDQDPITILGIIGMMEIEAAKEFSEFLDHRFKAEGDSNWFSNIRNYRMSKNEPFYYKDPSDLRFVLLEATLPDSQIWHLIPGMNQVWSNAADALRKKLNQYHHTQLNPNLETLDQVATLFDSVASGPGLEVGSWARALRGRISAIRSGTFTPVAPEKPNVPEVKPEAVIEVEKRYEEATREMAKRPAWGSRWTGPKPRRKLSLHRGTRDIYENGVSVGAELGDLFDHTVTMWLRYFPNGGEVWVDEDGATMAYVKGDQTMIGWFGPTPDEYSENVRGFVIPRDFQFTGDDVIDLASQKLLSKSCKEAPAALIQTLRAKLEPGTGLGITEYGDLFVPVSEGEPKRVTWAHKDVWFTGQLPG
jgi:hypothetical protein